MTDYIVAPPASKVVSVTRNTDCLFTLHRKDDNGAAADWDADVYLLIDDITSTPTRVDAAVSGADAVVRIEAETADLVNTGTAWRAVMSTSGDPTLETPVMVGSFERNDGGKK